MRPLTILLTLTQWAAALTMMACWGPDGFDAGLASSCLTMAQEVQTCQAAAGGDEQVFYDCLEESR